MAALCAAAPATADTTSTPTTSTTLTVPSPGTTTAAPTKTTSPKSAPAKTTPAKTTPTTPTTTTPTTTTRGSTTPATTTPTATQTTSAGAQTTPAGAACPNGTNDPTLCEVVIPPSGTTQTTSAAMVCPQGTSNPKLCEVGTPSTAGGKTAARSRAGKRKSTSENPAPNAGATYPLAIPGLPAGLTELAGKALNLLIGSFPVPPFLLPIYQAAGVDYGVPWQVLAAINEVETDYGRNLSVSSAGALGWMQFMPVTWATFGMDADGNGSANPYDPVDAIFSAARYLHAAGAQRSLPLAIFAYNHAAWYVNSVELRARLLQFLPADLVDGLTGLMQASYPVAGHLGSYATESPSPARVAGQTAATMNAPAQAPVIAVADARVVGLGQDAQLGRYVTIEDSYGDRFTYSGLGSIESLYPLLGPRLESAVTAARALDSRRIAARTPLPAATASAPGVGPATPSAVPPAAPATPAVPRPRQLVAMPKERLFADPWRPHSYAAGGSLQVQSSVSSYLTAAGIQAGAGGPPDYFAQPLRLAAHHFTLAPLTRGAVVDAGTVLGRVGASSTVTFQIAPAGSRSAIDPRPILAGWELLGRLTAGRSALAGAGQTGAYGAANPTLGQLLMASEGALQRAVLSDRRLSLDGCDRAQVQAGRVDRRVLAVIEYLSYSGLAPGGSLVCPQTAGRAGLGPRLEISQLAGIPVAGHQQDGGVVDLAARRLLGLQGALRPSRIISLRTYPWEPSAVALPDHASELEVDFPSRAAAGPRLGARQWSHLIGRLAQLGAQAGSR